MQRKFKKIKIGLLTGVGPSLLDYAGLLNVSKQTCVYIRER